MLGIVLCLWMRFTTPLGNPQLKNIKVHYSCYEKAKLVYLRVRYALR